jgi:eukaryotic-like serine/threonine-protein kinase
VAPPDTARWQRVRDLFDAVADLDAAQRPERLTELCAGDDWLRDEVWSLLAHDRASDDAIGRAVGDAARGATTTAPAIGPGKRVMHYLVTGPIGEGGMGIVWRALDETLGRDVAIKVLPPGLGQDQRRLSRFEREAKLLASLNHPNIAAIFSLHALEGMHFLAMEYVPGEDVSERLLRGPIPLADSLSIARQIADALEEAHERGVVHRDLKPANVKLTPSGKVKVLDFGLAKAFTPGSGTDSATSTSGDPILAQLSTREGAVLGTAAYMPPEQARGLSVDKRADIWAFGAVLYEMLTGARPFDGATTIDLLAAVVGAEPDWTRLPEGTPPAIERLLRRCLQKDVRQRLRDIGDARIEIEALIEGSSSASGSGQALPPSRPLAVASLLPAPSPTPRRWRRAVAPLAGAVAAGLAWWTLATPPAAPRAAVERFNIDVPPGTRLEDAVGAVRQALALSRDGSTLVFLVREPEGRRQLYMRRLDRVAAEPVAAAAGGDMPFLSPDGRWLGFAAAGKLKKVLLSGGQPVTLCDAPEPRGASWGDDDTIVFAAGALGGLSRVAAAGGTPTALTTIDPAGNESSHRWPLVLPGSRAVLFNVEPEDDDAGLRRIELVELLSGRRRRVVNSGTYARFSAGHLLFGQAGTLHAVPFDLDRLIVTGPAVPVLDDVRMDLQATGRVFVDVALSGTLAYVPGFPHPGIRRLVWRDREGRPTPVTEDSRSYRGARLSPDERHLAVLVEDVSSTTVWLFERGRNTWSRLTSSGEASTPAWTPDGLRILFSASLNGQTGIHAVPVDGSAAASPVSTGSMSVMDMPEVLPDGTQALVAVQSADGDDIGGLSFADGALTPVVTGPGNQVSPSQSPSGRFLAYSSNESGRSEVFVRTRRENGRKWTVSVAGGTTPRWRADERELFYVQGTSLMAVPIEATADTIAFGRPHALFEEPGLAWSGVDLTRYDVTADGRRFVVVQPEAWEVAPLSIVVAPRFVSEFTTRSPR